MLGSRAVSPVERLKLRRVLEIRGDRYGGHSLQNTSLALTWCEHADDVSQQVRLVMLGRVSDVNVVPRILVQVIE